MTADIWEDGPELRGPEGGGVLMRSTVNPLPPHRVGLWRVRVVPYPRKERGLVDRWRAIKARSTAPHGAGRGGN